MKIIQIPCAYPKCRCANEKFKLSVWFPETPCASPHARAAYRRRCRLCFEDIDLGHIHAGDAFGAEDSRHSGHFVLRQLTNLKPVLVAELPVEDLGVLPEPLLLPALHHHACALLVDPPQRNLGGERKLVMLLGANIA